MSTCRRRPCSLRCDRRATTRASAGHAYTCDGKQVPELPALCAPQQILVVHENGGLRQLTDWIDVPALLAQ